jgi:cytochrome c-type biogenesis protein CcmH
VSRRHFPVWTLLGVVLVGALLVGSGAFSSSTPTDAQRAVAIESVIRCPSCEDLSVAVSSAPTAVTVRATVAHLIDLGQTDQQVKDYLVARYGAAIVLDPPASGWSALVWVLPVAVGAAGTVGLVVVLVRRRRRGERDLDADVRGGRVDPVALEERRRFLTQSLADADAEYLAGDLSDADYLALRQRDLARLAVLGPASGTASGAPSPAGAGGSPAAAGTVAGSTASATDTLLEAHPDAAPTTPSPSASSATGGRSRRRGRNGWFLTGAVVCFVAALVVAVPLFTSNRLPGQTATGSVSLSPSQQLARSLDQAAAAENEGQLGLAAQLYQAVLSSHPDDEVALAQLGWLEYRIGQQGSSTSLLADARAKLNQAAALDPGDYAVHLYLGTVLLQQDGNPAGAVVQYRMFLAESPPASVLQQSAATVRAAFTQAEVPVPAGVPDG